jgi:iron-sulfur cluster repair protein YtfE (RIC family)
MLIDRGDFRGLIFTRLVEEHRDILAMLDAALRVAEDPVARVRMFSRLARVLRIHARAEEEIVFPVLDGSYELGHHVREDQAAHVEIDELIRRVETAEGDTWRAHVDALRTAMLRHFADEEEVLFPGAHNVISDQHGQDMLIEYEALILATP